MSTWLVVLGMTLQGRRYLHSSVKRITHWASGRVTHIEVNLETNPMYCYVHSTMNPSMKQGKYHRWLLLGRNGDFATVLSVTCECVAG